MVAAKKELFDEVLQQQANLFRVLGHPARLQIIRFLAETKTCYSGNISDELPLGRTTVNQHLKELKKAGIILGHVGGTKTNYCLNYQKMEELHNTISKFLNDYANPQTNCCK